MPTEIGQSRKNYIGIVSDKTEERRSADLRAKPDRLIKDYILGLIDAMLKRHGDAG